MNSAIICTIGCFGYIGYFCPKRLAVDAIVDNTSVRWEPNLHINRRTLFYPNVNDE